MNLDKQVANMGKFLLLSVVTKQLYGIVQQGHGFLSKTSPSQARTVLQQACNRCDAIGIFLPIYLHVRPISYIVGYPGVATC
jgi:hypothetical protein